MAAAAAVAAATVAGAYNHTAALAHLFLAAAAYCEPPTLTNWSCAPCLKAASAWGGSPFHVTSTFSGNSTEEHGFVAYAPGVVAVSFRGSAEFLNYWIDIEIYRAVPYAGCDDCYVHDGFISAWHEVADKVVAGVRAALKEQPGARIVVVGHSLGGAVAVLAALGLAGIPGLRPSAVYTFGEPRVGNLQFARFYATQSSHDGTNGALGWPTWRVTHEHDLVPHLPPRNVLVPYVLDYEHHTREVWYDSRAHPEAYVLCDPLHGEDFACADSVWIYQLSVEDHFYYMGQYVGLGGCATPQPGQHAESDEAAQARGVRSVVAQAASPSPQVLLAVDAVAQAGRLAARHDAHGQRHRRSFADGWRYACAVLRQLVALPAIALRWRASLKW
mmetsp:Transcript_2357/g.6675  ORF Transcript_2357/g.6675 Transcript_2357/m.6675 type:complete len:387 (-) Transcript_2357:2941-4101(-)